MQAAAPELYPFLIAGFLIAFALAFGIGANDVANSFGTSVGSKALTLRQACIFASIFEILGAILIGGKVSATIREGIIDPVLFRGQEKEYCLGLVSTLAGCCIWMLLATFFKLPVSGTHSIVGSTIGFALVSRGSSAIHWRHFAKIVASWFISPLLSGLISVIVYLIIRRFILFDVEKSFSRALKWLPFFYCITILINVFSVLLSGPSLFYFDRIPLWSKLLIAVLVGIISVVVVQFFVIPRILKKIKGTSLKSDLENALHETETRELLLKQQIEFNEVESDEMLSKENTEKVPLKEIRHFTIECTNESKEMGIQVDYIALLSDQPFQGRQFISMGSYPHFSINNDYPILRKRYAESEGAYATYRHSQERHRPMPRISLIRNHFDPNRQNDLPYLTSDIERTTQSRAHSDYMDGRYVSMNPSCLLENMNLPLTMDVVSGLSVADRHLNNSLICSSSTDSMDDDYEPDEIKERVKYIDSVKNQSKRDDEITESVEVGKLFSFLQIMTAIFGSFAHGGNDVSNAIGPLISLWLVFAEGTVKSSKSPIWVLFYGGVGIIFGLWIWGRRVMKTIGEDLTKITPSVGFVIEVSSAFTVLFASNLSIPVSTTHCKVGSVVFTGRVRSKKSVDWSLFGNIIIAWLVTVPVTGIISAALTALFRNSVLVHNQTQIIQL